MELTDHANCLDDDDLVEVPAVHSNFREELRCAVCFHFGTLWTLLPCSHVYCKSCVDFILEKCNASSCPECKMQFRTEDILVARDRNHLSAKLAVLCTREGRNNGCGWEGCFDSRDGHVAECGFQPVKCPHGGCTTKNLIRKKLPAHKGTCGFRVVNCCHLGCSMTFLKRQKKEKAAHERSCDKKLVSCDLCKEGVQKEKLVPHMETSCEEAQVTCAQEFIKGFGVIGTDSRKRSRAELEDLLLESPNALSEAAGPENAAFAFIKTCTWEGKRHQLSDHRKECSAYAMCTQMLSLITTVKSLQGIIKKQADDIKILKKFVRDHSTFIWDVRFVDPLTQTSGSKITSPEFSLLGRKWKAELFPAGDPADTSKEYYGLYLHAVGLQEGERIRVTKSIQCGRTTHIFRDVHTSENSSWGHIHFGCIPVKFQPIKIRIIDVQADPQ